MSRADSPENCHLNVKKIPKIVFFLFKNSSGNFPEGKIQKK